MGEVQGSSEKGGRLAWSLSRLTNAPLLYLTRRGDGNRGLASRIEGSRKIFRAKLEQVWVYAGNRWDKSPRTNLQSCDFVVAVETHIIRGTRLPRRTGAATDEPEFTVY